MLEVRLLYQQLQNYNQMLEITVQDRTAELGESEARFRRFTELSSDCYWEQDEHGNFTHAYGPILEMLGSQSSISKDATDGTPAGHWDTVNRTELEANIAARRPFLDFIYSRMNADGTNQYFQVSGEPMFDASSRFTGYRGVAREVTEIMNERSPSKAA
ncbi:hypothetical protein GALL_388210 [mine drainage metagenome]|uniref:Uncharacterized protein n=1 Tax=mine drainage metagenome TaxID=410659 RepID=A0A1J5QHK2_9ZZZZ